MIEIFCSPSPDNWGMIEKAGVTQNPQEVLSIILAFHALSMADVQRVSYQQTHSDGIWVFIKQSTQRQEYMLGKVDGTTLGQLCLG